MAEQKEQCVHYWIMDEYNIGTSKKCGEIRDFGVLQEKNRLMLAERQAEIARHPAKYSVSGEEGNQRLECAYNASDSPAGDPDCGQASSAIAIQTGSQNPPTAETRAKISAALRRRHNKKGR